MFFYLALLLFAALLQPLPARAGISQPVLLWQNGGCKSFCQTGWYSSPAVASLDGKGAQVIVATYGVAILDGKTGDTLQTYDPQGDRAWPGVVVADLEKQGNWSIITAHGGGYLEVYDERGAYKWSRQPSSNEIRSLAVADLDHDGYPEIVVGTAGNTGVHTWVYDHTGALRAGWPQLQAGVAGVAAGVYNDNVALGSLSGKDSLTVYVPSDVHYICAYKPDGAPVPAAAVFGSKAWGQVGVWEDTLPEHRGYGACDGNRVESYRTNFASGAAVIADVDGDGRYELVVTGSTYDCHDEVTVEKYAGLYIFNEDRTRFKNGAYDWNAGPRFAGAPLSGDYNVIENANPDPVVADIDNNGEKEILYSAMDGKVHCFWLDKTEHGHWPFVLNAAAGDTDYAYATPPVVADLDGDGKAEVLFGSWTRHGSKGKAYFYVLDDQGDVKFKTGFPTGGGNDFSGSMASPTLADVNGDGSLDIVFTTVNAGAVAFSIPGARTDGILWGTGRANYLRNGYLQSPGRLPGAVMRGGMGAQGRGSRELLPAGFGARRFMFKGKGAPLEARVYSLKGKLIQVAPVLREGCVIPGAGEMRILVWGR